MGRKRSLDRVAGINVRPLLPLGNRASLATTREGAAANRTAADAFARLPVRTPHCCQA
jgi:hypothetical protein